MSNSPVVKQPTQEVPKCTMSDKSTEPKEDFKQEVLEAAIEPQAAFKEKSEMTETLKAIRKSPSKKSKRPKSDHVDFCKYISKSFKV